jgi:2-C-methyl-D-erythritol 4-phosphate cytidylyltransferase
VYTVNTYSCANPLLPLWFASEHAFAVYTIIHDNRKFAKPTFYCIVSQLPIQSMYRKGDRVIPMNNIVTAIVLAAGQGKRMNTPVAKQFLCLRDKPVIYYSLKAFEESCVDRIILVTGKEQVEYCREHIVDQYHFKKVTQVIEGGKERYDSVWQALRHAETSDYVLIHDGARPFIQSKLIDTIIEKVIEYKACVVGTHVKETVKVVDKQGYIIDTPDRDTLWSAQTPQAFEYNTLIKAYTEFYMGNQKDELGITDDAMVFARYAKLPIKMIEGDYSNLKLTTLEDLTLAEVILSRLLCE